MTQKSDFSLPYNNLINYVPQNLRNQGVSALVDNLFNRFLTHDESVPLFGYVGRKPARVDDHTPKIPQSTIERDINSIIPVLSFKAGADSYAFTVEDLINKAGALGIDIETLYWLYSRGNNFVPPIDLDKFTNFFNYYWVAKAVTALPDMPWNTELLPEYYTIAPPKITDLIKLNAVAATTTNTVLTGTGFNKISLELTFTSPTTFTTSIIGSLGLYTPAQSSFTLTSNDQLIQYKVIGPAGTITLVEFNITREEIFDQYGVSVGFASFDVDDTFTIDFTFLSRNYTVAFIGTPGVKGKISKVHALNEYQVIDGVQLRAGDRVLVKNNSVLDDGIYIVSAGDWARAPDFDGATMVAGAQVFVKNGTLNGSKLFISIAGSGGYGFAVVPGVTTSNTNQWQEGNYWVKGEALEALGLGRADAVQAVRPIIEYDSVLQLNSFVFNGLPADEGVEYKQLKTEFDQLPLFDLYRYDGTHAGLVSSVFFYEEDLTGDLDLAVQKRLAISTNESADFLFNHGLIDNDGALLCIKLDGVLTTIWTPGYAEATVVDVTFNGIGNGLLSGTAASAFSQQQIWTLTALSATSFSVVGSKNINIPTPFNEAAVGTPYANGLISFTLSAGSTPFEAGDTFTIRIGDLEVPRYVYRDADNNITDLFGGVANDSSGIGAWQVPRTFYNNPYNENQASLTEGVLYSHFRSIIANQVAGAAENVAFGGSIKLWSEQQTLLAALLMQRDMTPISMIDLAQRQYETALNTIRDIFQQNIVQYLGDNGAVQSNDEILALLESIQAIRKNDNDVRTVLFDSTSPLIGFPATLPQLGISELVMPTIEFDNILGQTLLTHHDGHKSPLFVDDLTFRQSILGELSALQVKRSDGLYTSAVGSFTTTPPVLPYKGELWILPDGTMQVFDVSTDLEAPGIPTIGDTWYKRSTDTLSMWDGATWVVQSSTLAPWAIINLADTLNALMLQVETELHNGINPNARKFDFSELDTDASYNAQLKKELFSFAAVNAYDPLAPDYNAADAFTWNYSQTALLNLPALSTSAVPSRWYNLLTDHQSTVAGVIPTERPNLEPWKLFGFTTYDLWWATLSPTTQASYTPFLDLLQIDSTYIDGGSVKVVKVASGVTTLSGFQTIDGVSLITGDRVLIQNDDAPANNGIWIVSSSNWTRASTTLVAKLVLTASSGQLYKGSTWVLTATPSVGGDVIFKQARTWTNELWADVAALQPTLRLSVDTVNDSLLPPYVSSANGWAANALTNVIPAGVSLGYEFNQGSPVETVWRKSIEFKYSQARALFRFDPLAFLGFCWGFCWVEMGGILFDSFDMSMPGHKRFRLHGDSISQSDRDSLLISGSGGDLVVTATAYATTPTRGLSFTVSQAGTVLGYAALNQTVTFDGNTFTLIDAGKPFRMGDRFEISNGTAIFVPITTYIYQGFGQTFTHALRATSIDTGSSFAISAFREWEVNMGYRAGGLVATDDLHVYTDNETLSKAAYTLLIKKNQISKNEWVQALRISVSQFGAYTENDTGLVPTANGDDWIFRIEGYNPRFLDITYYDMSTSTNAVTFYALSKAHTDLVWLQPTENLGVISTSLPLTITGIQSVVNFLFGYSKYLEDRGWEFNKISDFNIDAETGRTRNFQLEIEKYVDRCFAGIKIGQGHVVNPFIDMAWFNQDTGLLSEFIDTSLFDVTGHPGVFDALGVKYRKSDLNVLRTNLQSSFGAAGPMFSAHVQIDEYEHIFVFNNYSQPSTGSGLLYDPFSAARVVTYKFNGRKQASNTMRPEFGGHFLVNNEVRQNLQASTDNVANFYDANHAFENDTTTRHSMALLGFNTKQYFDDLDISNKTQFNFWRGLIQSKGTNGSIAAYLNNNRFDDAKIDEYWAYKVATYGDARQKSFPELKLSVTDALTQFTQLQFDSDTLETEGFTTIQNFDESRWFSIDDLGQSTSFVAEVVGTFNKTDAEIDSLYTLNFIADKFNLTGCVQVNATTVKATATNVTVVGYGPARPRFNPIKLFNYAEQELVAEIPLWHPAAGQHTPTALESINVISNLNPAKYNYSTQVLNNTAYDPLRPWGSNEVGRVWFDTRNLSYLPYYDEIIFTSRDERLSRWGALSDFATIDVYEWVKSTVPPAEYNLLAREQAGDADLDAQTKAAGEVAGEQTYTRSRNWFQRPIAWSFSPTPLDVDWGATPPFPGGSTEAELFISGGLAALSKGTFANYNITAGMHIGAWNNSETAPAPLSEYLIEDSFTKVVVGLDGDPLLPQVVTTDLPCSVTVTAPRYSAISGQLLFSTVPTEVVQRDTLGVWDVTASMKITDIGSGATEYVVVTSSIGVSSTGDLHGATISLTSGEVINVALPTFGLNVAVVVTTGGTYDADALRNSIVTALANVVVVQDAVAITRVAGDFALNSLSNALDDIDFRYGWRAWSIPSQTQLDADSHQPVVSWKPYLGDFFSIEGNLSQVQNAVAYAKAPLTLNDGTVVQQYSTTWTNWEVLNNVVRTQTQLATGESIFSFDDNIDQTVTSVYVNGIAQLKAAFTIVGKVLTVNEVSAGSIVTVIVHKLEPTTSQLAFDPTIADNLAIQEQFKKDFEYVSLPTRDDEGALSATVYYFWVKNKTTTARDKKLSIQAITQELQTGPTNFLTFQHIVGTGSLSDAYRYDAITISGLSFVVTKDDAFKLRFTRNFTLRDDPEELNLKNTHTEWSLMRPGQKTRVPEGLWSKLIDSVAGADAAGNAVPAVRRVLYDERNGSRTQFGFTSEQTLAPAELLRSSITYTILNTRLEDTSGSMTVPDYIAFLDLDESDSWFLDAAASRKTLTDIWNLASVAQINEIFFAALDDILASNYELDSIFKTSRLSAYSIKVVSAAPVAQTYE